MWSKGGDVKAGNLDRRITLQRATLSDDGFGQVQTWADLATVWAAKEDISDGERWRAHEVAATVTTRFRVRWSSVTGSVTPKDRLVYDGRTYDVFAVKEIGRREGVEITAGARAE